jgi:hypothetical protein
MTKKKTKNIYNRLPKSLTTVTPFSWIIAIFVFTIFIYSGFLIFDKYVSKTNSLENTETNSFPTPQKLNLKTYTTPLYSIGYPESYGLRFEEHESMYLPMARFYSNPSAKDLDITFSVAVQKNDENLTLDQLTDRAWPGTKSNISTASVDGSRAKILFSEKYHIANIYTLHNNKIYQFYFYLGNGLTTDGFRQIMSTFKFVN